MTAVVGTVLVALGYGGLLVWAFSRGAAGESGWRDLRWWVAVLVSIQVVLYLVF